MVAAGQSGDLALRHLLGLVYDSGQAEPLSYPVSEVPWSPEKLLLDSML